MPRVSGTTANVRLTDSGKLEAVVDGNETLNAGMAFVIDDVSRWNAQYVKRSQALIDRIEHPVSGGHAFQRKNFHPPQRPASLMHRDDLADRIARRSILAKPVFRKGLQQERVCLGLLQEGQDRAMVGMLSTGLDALKVICCIAMYGKGWHDT